MPTYGLTSTGFLRKRLADIRAEMEAAFRDAFGPAFPVSGDSVGGQLIGTFAEREAELWELAEDVYNSAFPDTAEGVSLANVAAIVGIAPLPATYSTVTAQLVGTAGTLIPSGSVVAVTGTGARFLTQADVTLDGAGEGEVECRAEETGPVEAPIDTLTVIVTPIAGWDSITNAAASETGRAAETDAELRARRAESLTTSKGGTIAAVEAALRLVSGVVFAGVKENRTDATDGDGLPPHSLSAFVVGGADQDILDTLWRTKPAGIATYGSEDGTVTDSFGNAQTLYFNRGTDIPIYLDVERTTDGDYPADGDDLIQDLLLAYFDTLTAGDDVVNWRLMAQLASIPGIVTLTIKQGTTASPTLTDTISIAGYELATLDPADITVGAP